MFTAKLKISGSVFLILLSYSALVAEIGLWTSSAELASKPTFGEPWQAVVDAADAVNPNAASVSNQDSNNNVEILAAAIAFARNGNQVYRNKVVTACELLVAGGNPGDRTLAWARETGAYALAADLVDYRTPDFELWLRNMAEGYIASDNRTMLEMFYARPNNWGTMGFGSLCAIYGFLQDTTRLDQIKNYWIQSVLGPKPAALNYGDDLSWHVDQNNLRLVNPKGSVKEGLNIDGVIPDDMRRNGSFSNPPPVPTTSYHWEVLQGIVMGARILDRLGMGIWAVSDSAIYRAVYILQVEWENAFGNWKAEGDDLWMLPFIDEVYGTNYTIGQPSRVWEHGKNTGWPYVVWDGTTGIENNGQVIVPAEFEIFQNYPNPFNSVTNIHFYLNTPARVRIEIYAISGKKIITLLDDFYSAGDFKIKWNAEDNQNQKIPTGIYICRLKVNGTIRSNIMVYTK
jgi:hypothetical protein